MEKRRFISINIGFCFIKIRKSYKDWKERGTSASVAGHCYYADDRIIKVSNKFENSMRCECFLYDWTMLFFILSALIQKQEQRVV